MEQTWYNPTTRMVEQVVPGQQRGGGGPGHLGGREG